MRKNKKQSFQIALMLSMTATTATTAPFFALQAKAEGYSDKAIEIHEANEHTEKKNEEYKRKLERITNMVNVAETTLSGEDVFFATLFLDKLKNDDKEILGTRLKNIPIDSHLNKEEELQEAERLVHRAEVTRSDKELTKAQEKVNNLSLSIERMEFIERLQTIVKEKIKEKERAMR